MKRILSVLLALVMIVGMIPMSILTASAADGATYVKVTSAPTDWSGTYLIVYDAGTLAFNGGLTKLDAGQNNINVTISDNSIVADATTNAAAFTIEKNGDTGYSIKSASGYYIGATSNSNSLLSNTSTKYVNTITLESDGVKIVGSGGAVLRYNASSGTSNERFRFYKSSSYTNQKAISLYKLTESEGSGECTHANTESVEAVAATCTTAGFTAGTFCNDCERYIDGHEIIAALGHDWSDWVQTTAPSCDTEGVETATCGNCSETKTQSVDATGHTYVDGVCSGCGKEKGAAVATQITTAAEFISGEYVLVVSSGYAMGAYDKDTSWVLPVQPEIADGELLDAAGAVWTLTVDGSSVIIKDANGVAIAPKGGNNNGIASGDYSWAWSVNEDGTFVFAGTGEDTVKLASNTTANSGDNKFRAYKTTTIEGNTTTYLANFSVYKLNAGGGVEPDPENPACEHANQTTTTVPATCGEAGSTTVTCDDCNEIISTTEIPATGEHKNFENEEVKATCEEDGSITVVCADCYAVISTEIIKALGHNYVDGTCSVCGEAEPSTPAASSVTIDFSTTAQRVSQDTSSQVWSNGTLTVTNTGSVADYHNPVRFYKNSEVVISFAGMTKIEIACNTVDYATALVNSISDESAAVTVTDKIVTIVLATAVDTYSITMSAAQVRVDSITVESSECSHEWGAWETVTQATCENEGMEKSVCGLCGEEKTQTVAKTAHTMSNGTCSVCGAEYYTLSTTLNNNDSVIIYYPANKVAMTATASGKGLSGASVTIDESGLLGNTDVAVMKVQYVEGSSTDFYLICDGKYLTSGATGNSLTMADTQTDYAVWYIEIVEGGDSTVYIRSRNAAYNGNANQALEYYNGFTTYGIKAEKAYYFQLYTKGENAVACEHEWSDWEIVTNATCTEAGEQKSVCSKCGAEKTQTIAATGHSYVFGDTEVTCAAGDVNVAKTDIINVPKTADSNVYYVEGVVTFVDGGTVYMQDATGGVALRLASDVSAPAVGTLVEAIGTCSVYNGLIQLQNADFEAVSTDNTVDAQEVTLAELMADTELSYLSEKVSMKGLTITAVGTYNTNYQNVDYTVSDGTNTIKLYRAPAATADSVLAVGDVIDVIAVVGTYNGYQLRVVNENDITKLTAVAEVDGTKYYTFEAAYEAMDDKAIKLLANIGENGPVLLTKTIYVDLNGFNMYAVSGNANCTVYGMDSSTDSFTAEKWGVLSVEGAAVAPMTNTYLAVSEGENKWSFHAFSVKLTHVSLDPANDALGYKAQFFGDEMVLAQVESFGFNLWLTSDRVVSKSVEKVENGQIVTLRLNNIFANNGSRMTIFAEAFVTFKNTETVKTTTHHTSMMEAFQAVNTALTNNPAAYNATQIGLLKDLIERYEGQMEDWEISAIKEWTAPEE